MDFGWNKPASQDQNNSTQVTTDDAKTPVVDDTPAATPAATPASSWDLPGDNNKQDTQGGMTSSEEDLDFSASKSDDSFGNDFTVNPSTNTKQVEDNIPEEKDEKEASPEDDQAETPSIEKTEEDQIEAVKTEIEEKSEPTEDDIQNAAPTNGGKSLTELENDILGQKNKVDKDLADLQTKATKLEELLSKIRKMQDEEKNLIQEISSAL